VEIRTIQLGIVGDMSGVFNPRLDFAPEISAKSALTSDPVFTPVNTASSPFESS
jgi:hypothetical protein